MGCLLLEEQEAGQLVYTIVGLQCGLRDPVVRKRELEATRRSAVVVQEKDLRLSGTGKSQRRAIFTMCCLKGRQRRLVNTTGLQLGKIGQAARDMSPPPLGRAGDSLNGDTCHDGHGERLVLVLVGSGQVVPQMAYGLAVVV